MAFVTSQQKYLESHAKLSESLKKHLWAGIKFWQENHILPNPSSYSMLNDSADCLYGIGARIGKAYKL